MTVFGFNTDIKYGDTVFHVQSEERHHDALLQTQVFVRGRCIGKHANSYAHIKDKPGFTEEQMHELLKSQHKFVVEAVRAGRVDEVLHAASDPAIAEASAPVAPSAAEKPPQQSTLELRFINPDSIFANNTVTFRFLVTNAGAPVKAARLVARFQAPAIAGHEQPPVYAQTSTSPDGCAEIVLQVSEPELHQASLLLQVTHSTHVITRKFRLRGK